ncbi:BPSS1780 family membrane protein [Pseudoxanthomonas sp. UTMC 1351]|uniref:BPSS1780 family membrane protein n=1 Tax=Pseudoxanthomonas sp. UTMC 1351 TaxID=2695853 RepID=UPI0034CD537F
MSMINKVPASAGAEWLLGGFALLRKAPLALGRLAVLWGLVSLVVMLAAIAVPVLMYGLQFLLILAGPLFFAGMILAVREVDQDRPALSGHLLQPVRDGHARSLLATLLPQALAALILGGLLFVVVGTEQLKHLSDVMAQMQVIAESGGKADPSMLEGLPVGRLLLWVLLVLVSFVAVKWMTFIATPQIIFSGKDALTSMRNSLRACLHNWTAMLVFYLLAGIAIFAISIGLFLVASLLQLLMGATLAMLLWQLMLMAVLMPVLAGAAYYAWRQMMGVSDRSTPSPMATHIEV